MLPNEPVIATSAIQGNIVPGFATDDLALVGLTLPPGADAALAGRFVASLARTVTSGAVVLHHRDASRRRRRPPALRADETWLNVGLSHALLRRLGLPDFADPSFREGLSEAAARRLGDAPSRAVAVGAGTAGPVDILFLVAGAGPTGTDRAAAGVREAAASHGFVATVEQRGRRLRRGIEHFGFVDGVSQPGLLGRSEEDHERPVTPRPWDVLPDGTGALFVDAGTPLVWPGEFVFGYPGQHGTDRDPGPPPTAFRVRSDPHEAWARDGAYLVFRQMRQDVAGFWAYCEDQAAALAHGPLPNATAEMVGALIVGRWRDGSPIRLDDADGGRSRPTRNDFDLSDDPFGFGCPLGAHTRKVNPRSGAIADTSPLDKRLLRRGIPYGDALPGIVRRDDPDRGLLFLAYMTSITDQFEFVVSRWVNDPHAPSGGGSGQDVLIGQPAAGRTMSVTLPGGKSWPFLPPAAFVEPIAGQYLFAPSIPALAALAA
jgi:Dyp-type peroxidase family